MEAASRDTAGPGPPGKDGTGGIRDLANQTGSDRLTRGKPGGDGGRKAAMAEVACDKRHSVAPAERAAARYGAAVRHEAFLASLPRSSEQEALSAWARVLGKERPT